MSEIAKSLGMASSSHFCAAAFGVYEKLQEDRLLVGLVMELFPYSLYDRLMSRPDYMLPLCRQLLLSQQHLHRIPVLHLDLKLDNVMVWKFFPATDLVGFQGRPPALD